MDFSPIIRARTEHFIGRDWVFEAIHDWVLAPNPSRVFLLTGDPGTGKSAVAARLVQMSSGEIDAGKHPALGKNSLAHHHFCQEAIESTLSPLTFVQGFSERLANRYPGFRKVLERSASRQIVINSTIDVRGNVAAGAEVIGVNIPQITIEVRGTDARPLFDEMVRRPLQDLCRDLPDERILVMVDSLDEALLFNAENNIAQLLKLAADFPPQVRFILTARAKSQRVFEILGEPTLDLVADAPLRKDEVKRYVFSRVPHLPESVRHGVALRIADASNENFLYAHHVVNDLLAHGGDLEDPALLELPASLEHLYRRFLQRELAADPRRWNDVYRPLLGPIAVARGSGLTKAQLVGISGLAEDTTSDVLAVCAQYLAGGETPESPYRIYHQSFREFLLDGTYSVYPAERHAAIARYLQDSYGSSWGKCRDAYALRYTPTHWAEAAALSKTNRALWAQNLIGLLGSTKYQRQFEKEIGDLALLRQHFESAVRAAALSEREDMLPWLLKASRAAVGFREQYLQGEAVVSLARAGKLEQAEARLQVFEHLDSDWQLAARLVVAWLASDRNPSAAKQLLHGVPAVLPPELQLLRRRLGAGLEGEPGVFVEEHAPLPLDVGFAIVRRIGGQEFDRELLGTLNESMIVLRPQCSQTASPVNSALSYFETHPRGYAASSDAPVLVNIARESPEQGTPLLDEYIDAHAGYNYVEYRNRSLWLVLHAVLRHHPDSGWIRERVGKILVLALTGGGVDFREMLPLTAAALLAQSNDGGAKFLLDDWRARAFTAADLLQSRRNANDSWGNHKRRLVALLELYALVLRDKTAAQAVSARIGLRVPGEAAVGPGLPFGFAGFQAPANLRLADALRASGLSTPALLDAALESSLAAAHNIQDYHFAARVTARCNALRRWHGFVLESADLTRVIGSLARAPGALEFSADHVVHEPYHYRPPADPSTLPIDPARDAQTLEALGEVFQRSAVEFRRYNSAYGLTDVLAPGALVHIPDPGLAPLLAIHLAARVLADPLLDGQRSELIRSLVPVAVSNATALDTVLSYLLIAAGLEDSEVLEDIAEAAGPVVFTDPGPPVGELGPDGPFPS